MSDLVKRLQSGKHHTSLQWHRAIEREAEDEIQALTDQKDALAESTTRLMRECQAHRDKARGDYWAWQGDGGDYLGSLICPVLIDAASMREIVADVERRGQGRIKLLKAFALMGSPLCEDLHHEKHQYHSHDEPCPVETKIRDLIQEGST